MTYMLCIMDSLALLLYGVIIIFHGLQTSGLLCRLALQIAMTAQEKEGKEIKVFLVFLWLDPDD